jgi:hypothetical protein
MRAYVTDAGAEAFGDMAWDDASPAECPECGFDATLGHFRADGVAASPATAASEFVIDSRHSDDTYLFVEVDGFRVSIKREAEGVVVDILAAAAPRESIASTYAFHREAITHNEGDSL